MKKLLFKTLKKFDCISIEMPDAIWEIFRHSAKIIPVKEKGNKKATKIFACDEMGQVDWEKIRHFLQ